MERFHKFRKKFQTEAIWKANLYGFSGGALVASILWLVQKLRGVRWSFLFPLLIFLGVGACLTVAAFFLLRPSAKKVAKRLDERLSLKETTQTMHEFAGEEGEMIRLQRQDAEAKLANAPKSVTKPRGVWTCVVALVLAVASVVTAALIPVKQTTGASEPPAPPYEEEDREDHLKMLATLIEDVESGSMETALKTTVLAKLNELYDALTNTEEEALMRQLVVQCILDVDSAVEAWNTYRPLAKALNATENKQVQNLSVAISTGTESSFTTYFSKIQRSFTKAARETGETGNENGRSGEETSSEPKKNPAELATAFEAELAARLAASGVSATDKLYLVLQAVGTDFAAFAAEYASYSAEERNERIEAFFETESEKILDPLLVQGENATERDYVVAQMKAIFEISDDELADMESLKPLELTIPTDEEDANGSNSGGAGTGETLMGDDTIYEPSEEDYVKYGTVLDEYKSKVDWENLSPEAKAWLEAYFNALAGQSSKD